MSHQSHKSLPTKKDWQDWKDHSIKVIFDYYGGNYYYVSSDRKTFEYFGFDIYWQESYDESIILEGELEEALLKGKRKDVLPNHLRDDLRWLDICTWDEVEDEHCKRYSALLEAIEKKANEVCERHIDQYNKLSTKVTFEKYKETQSFFDFEETPSCADGQTNY